MLERDLQNYLFDNPEVLFPGEVISRKRREVPIEGRRIDLLFEVADVQYIIEIKRDTIRREDIGQVFEYYGLMRQSHALRNFRMMLVAPSIPAYRRIPLEEYGIRCVEVQHRPTSTEQRTKLTEEASSTKKRTHQQDLSAVLSPRRIEFSDLLPPIKPVSLQMSQLLLRDGLPAVQQLFSQYEVMPVKMLRAHSPDVFCFPDLASGSRFVGGGAWWAFSFGKSEQMPKNDVPNISVSAMPWGLDFAINAELQTSQTVMRRRIERSSRAFDKLVQDHGSLEWQAWLKLELQPRFYHWIPLVRRSPGTWRGQDLLDHYQQSERDFPELRTHWLNWIKQQRAELTPRQSNHMEKTNRNLNMALRLVHSVTEEESVWSQPYASQQAEFQDSYRELKPLIDFFQ